MFAAARTCCKCNVPGKSIQIHHIDEDPSNNGIENLAVLCFECHDETQVRGGFGRRLDAAQVRRFRDDWNERMAKRRAEADRIASQTMAPAVVNQPGKVSSHPGVDLQDYVGSLPELRRRALATAKPSWQAGSTADMVEAAYRVIDVLEEVLTSLAMYYPPGHFHPGNPRDYITQVISDRFRWQRLRHQPNGEGKDGTIVYPMIAGSVMTDLERMVEQMVQSLLLDWSGESEFQEREWLAEWRGERSDVPPLRSH